MQLNVSGINHLSETNPLGNLLTEVALPGSWADWANRLSETPSLEGSGLIFRHAESLAKAAAISTEAATALLLWLGSSIMLRHTEVQWPSGIWQPAGLPMVIVEEDQVPIDSITNSFIKLARNIDIDPINETVKEGPAGLIARLESAGRKVESNGVRYEIESLAALAQFDTQKLEAELGIKQNHGNSRALIYPSGRAFLSYLYDTPFFNTIDELIQHGSLNVRGKTSSHNMSQVHLSMLTTFFQGSLVTMTTDSRVQNGMLALMRQLLVLWPTSGIRRYQRAGRIDQALHRIERIAVEGNKNVAELTNGILFLPEIPYSGEHTLLESEGAGVRYTVLDRAKRISRLAIGVAFWRIADGGEFSVNRTDLAVADSILHLHEMGGRLFELVMSKAKIGHEFMRIFVRLLNGEKIQIGEELAMATELTIGSAAILRLQELSIIDHECMLMDEYRLIKGTTIAAHKKRWNF